MVISVVLNIVDVPHLLGPTLRQILTHLVLAVLGGLRPDNLAVADGSHILIRRRAHLAGASFCVLNLIHFEGRDLGQVSHVILLVGRLVTSIASALAIVV